MIDPWPTVLANLPLAQRVARRWARNAGEFDDFYGAAVLALRDAALTHREGRGMSLAGFMRWTSNRALRGVRSDLDAPVHLPHLAERTRRRADDVERDDGELVNPVELLADEDTPAPDVVAVQHQREAAVLRAVELLPERQRELVAIRYLDADDEVPLETAGQRMGLRREATRQLEKAALRTLREHLSSGPAAPRRTS